MVDKHSTFYYNQSIMQKLKIFQKYTKVEKYRKDIIEAYKKLDLKAFFIKKINEKRYFNKCELEYIHRYYSDIYEKAKEYLKKIEIENTNDKGKNRNKESKKR